MTENGKNGSGWDIRHYAYLVGGIAAAVVIFVTLLTR